MRRFLLDTGPAQEFLNNRQGVRQRADLERRDGHRIGICMPVEQIVALNRRTAVSEPANRS